MDAFYCQRGKQTAQQVLEVAGGALAPLRPKDRGGSRPLVQETRQLPYKAFGANEFRDTPGRIGKPVGIIRNLLDLDPFLHQPGIHPGTGPCQPVHVPEIPPARVAPVKRGRERHQLVGEYPVLRSGPDDHVSATIRQDPVVPFQRHWAGGMAAGVAGDIQMDALARHVPPLGTGHDADPPSRNRLVSILDESLRR